MKKILFTLVAVVTTAIVFAGTPPEVNEKVLRAFKETFTSPQDVVWYEYDNYYEVNFKQSETMTHVWYDQEGNILETIRYYYEQQLPLNILSIIKKRYPGRKIYGVTEISLHEQLNYHVTMFDDKNWYTVKSDASGNLEQTEKFKKAEQ
jgi:hypothetical protein